jgi:hypothetical protein
MLLRALIGIHCENHTEQIHVLCGQNTGKTHTYCLALYVNVQMNSDTIYYVTRVTVLA